VLVVFASHVTNRLPGGFVGVDIFFVLSGYLITGLLVREYQKRRRVDLRAFYVRRGLRLYPALVVAVASVACITPIIGYGWRRYGIDAATSLTYTYNFWLVHGGAATVGHKTLIGPFWSLCVEEQYYLLWPLLLVPLLRRGTTYALAGTLLAALVAFAVQAAVVPALYGPVLYVLPLGHAYELLIGSLLGIVMTARAAPLFRQIVSQPIVWLAWCPIAIVALLVTEYSRWLYLGGFAGLAVCSCAIIAHLATRGNESSMGRLLGSRPAAWLGRRSYAVYLFHRPVIFLLNHYGLPFKAMVPLALALTLLLAALSFILVERPALRLKRNWERAPDGEEQVPGQFAQLGSASLEIAAL
jgi:peptidoglycan/LPS O-acetylase OafA/YrhL